jgi:hypothetical protein
MATKLRRSNLTHQRPLALQGVDILQAFGNPILFPQFQGDSWKPWRTVLAALFGLPMDAEQLAFYRDITGRQNSADKPFKEGWLICGRRGGKSNVLAFIGVYMAIFKDYSRDLAPGEWAIVRIMAGSRDQAQNIFRFVHGMLHGSPYLEGFIVRETMETFELSNRVKIEIGPASFRTTRGFTYAAILADEVSIWYSDESANPASEILAACRPGMGTIPDSILLAASSPLGRTGPIWDAYDKWYGKEDKPLVVRAPTRTMNNLITQAFIDQQTELDPIKCAAEYLVEFRGDIETFIELEQIRACIQPGVHERAPVRDYRYWAFCDPSGGRADSMTLAIAHRAGNTVVLDLIREREPPFSPEGVVEEFAELMRQYRINKVVMDRYGGEWVSERFKAVDITPEATEHVTTELYLYFLPMVNSRGVDLLDHNPFVYQLNALKRIPSRTGGRDRVEHPRGAHDDICNAVAGACVMASQRSTVFREKKRIRGYPADQCLPTRNYDVGPGEGWMGT